MPAMRGASAGAMLLARATSSPALGMGCASTWRGLAKKAVAKPTSAGPQVSSSAPADLQSVVHGLNILKDGTDPSVRPDEEYPDWVWSLCAASTQIHALQCPSTHFSLATRTGTNRWQVWRT